MKKILRVFPQRTSYTPIDDFVCIGEPPNVRGWLPEYDEVHISCCFTWDKTYCEHLKYQWQGVTNKPVLLGGPAYNSPIDTFTPGMYVKQGVTFTSRGCNNACEWCAVSEREGKIKELPVTVGNIIQDNNFLSTSIRHKNLVFEMLKSQKGICFKGGLQANLIDDHFIAGIAELKVKELWLACDTDSALPAVINAIDKLTKAGYTKEHIMCYVLIGDDMNANEKRLQAIFNAGALPRAQLYQPIDGDKIYYGQEWTSFNGRWCRPARTKAHMKQVFENAD